MKIVAVVPIKLNNERLPGKNIKDLGGKPLLNHILLSLLAVDQIDEVLVYCSDSHLVEILPNRVKFFKRSAELDKPASNFTQIFTAFSEEKDADIYVYAHATAPYISASTIEDCINHVVSGEYDSAFTAAEIRDFLWTDSTPLNFDPQNIPRSQDLKPVYRETSGIYVFVKSVFQKHSRRVGDKPYIKVVPYKESIDINEPEDFEIAQLFLGYKGGTE